MVLFRKARQYFIFLCISLIFLGNRAACLNPEDSFAYKTYVFGVDDLRLRTFLSKNSLLVQQESTPPPTVQAIRNMAEQDLVNLQKALAAQGYYDAQLDYFVDVRQTPVHVYLKINLGPQYTLGAFKIKSDPLGNNQVSYLASNIQILGVSLGTPATRDFVQESIKTALKYLQMHGYAFAKLKEDHVVIDRVSKKMLVALLFSPGPMVRFGNTFLEQNGEVTGEFIKQRLQWKKGEVYSEKKVMETLQILNNTQLFKVVRITHDDYVDQNGLMNMYIKLEGVKKNVFRPIARFTPGIGTEFGVSYQRFNAFKKGQVLSLEGGSGHSRKHVKANLMTPDVVQINTNLNVGLVGLIEQFKWYALKEGALKASLDAPLNEITHAQAGLGFEISRVEQQALTHDYRLLSLPMALTFKTKEGEAGPKEAARLKVEWTPYLAVFNRMNVFDTLSVKPDLFLPLFSDNNLIFHGWAKVDLAPGAGRHVLPVNKQFEALVRGYEYGYAGPTVNGLPAPSRSMLSFGAELEYYLTPQWSVLTFLDVGTTYNRWFPDFQNRLLCGVGGGLHYHSRHGIFYAELASPINRRANLDAAVEIYAGIKHPV